MTRDDETRFEPRLDRSHAHGDRSSRPPVSFMQQVMRAVARAGGDPRRIGHTEDGPLQRALLERRVRRHLPA